jgi:hypothetical protein
MLAIACMKKYDDERVKYCLDTSSLYVSIDTYKRGKNFGWMEMGIVVKIHVPIQHFGELNFQKFKFIVCSCVLCFFSAENIFKKISSVL